MCSFWQGLSFGNLNFQRVTFTVIFDLLLNIGQNFHTVRDWAFIFGMCSLCPYLSNGTKDFKHVTLTVNFDFCIA